jgi:hypothetical protein
VLPPRPNGPDQGSYKPSFSSGGVATLTNNPNNLPNNLTNSSWEQAHLQTMEVQQPDEAFQHASAANYLPHAGDATGAASVMDEDHDVFRQRQRQQ